MTDTVSPAEPTKEELYGKIGLRSVLKEVTECPIENNSEIYEVFFREYDQTYWAVFYMKDDNSLLVEDYDCFQVEPYQKVITSYRGV